MRRLLLLAISIMLAVSALNSTESDGEEKIRSKRHYYGGYDYGYGDDYWYAGRIFGIIAGSLLFLLCCCTPCICLAGIWFLGWFGLRNRRERRSDNKAKAMPATVVQEERLPPPPPATVYTTRQPREVIIDTAPPPRPRERSNDHVIYQAEDRFYSSSAPATDSRPFRSSNF